MSPVYSHCQFIVINHFRNYVQLSFAYYVVGKPLAPCGYGQNLDMEFPFGNSNRFIDMDLLSENNIIFE